MGGKRMTTRNTTKHEEIIYCTNNSNFNDSRVDLKILDRRDPHPNPPTLLVLVLIVHHHHRRKRRRWWE